MIDNLALTDTVELMESCSSCQKKLPVQKQMVFSKDSSVLVMEIKVFERMDDGALRKIISKIDIDDKVLIPQGHENVEKGLACVVYHIGKTKDSGHYVARFQGPNGIWFQADDARVSVVKSPRLATDTAMPYVVFYTTLDPVPDSIHRALSTLASRFEFLPLMHPQTR
jgi:ubiquitin carboxyl-terminal hydrolase 36/42